jgi:hypothetical protein
MKAKRLLLFLFCFLGYIGSGSILWSYSAGVAMPLRCDKQTLQQVLYTHLHFDPPYDIVSSASRHDLCEAIIRKKNQLIPVYTNGSWAIIGDFVSDKQLVTPLKIKELEQRRLSVNIIRMEQCVNFEYVPKTALVNESVFMFFSPSCFSCTKIKKDLTRIADKYKITIKVIVCPVAGLTDNALRWFKKSITFDEFVTNIKPPSGTTGQQKEQMAAKNIQVFEDLNITGLPAFIFKSTGSHISTGSADKLERFILDNLMHTEGGKSLKSL